MSSTSKHERLDSLVVSFFKKLEDLSALRRQLDQELKDGFLFMAKARSNMGQKSITSSQYDEREIIPNLKVEHDHRCVSFGLIKNKISKADKGALESDKSRKRNIENVGGQGDAPSEDTKLTRDSELVDPKDPLLMFGLLVPQSLRHSKACFQRCVTVSAKICETQAELMDIKSEYQELLQS